ncbi:unnamed protein product [Cuscuta campestris]|uniref:Uncharacterized protein n=1 Tax=Cuscuta campestris TaxID=132261 RepID=A0A484MIR5_9ASTE|nr:unnamed protein product [Cuscuta campestris]
MRHGGRSIFYFFSWASFSPQSVCQSRLIPRYRSNLMGPCKYGSNLLRGPALLQAYPFPGPSSGFIIFLFYTEQDRYSNRRARSGPVS